MNRKTPHTAVVAIPPENLWDPIQRIRSQYDRHVDRWMPHVTLVYPFRPREEFDAAAQALAKASAGVVPFEVSLADVKFFEHGPGRFTIWMAPEPAAPIVDMQAVLARPFPDCDDVARYASGFTPHLSVGQADGRQALEERMARIRSGWIPLQFPVREVALIAREGDAPFRVERTFPLG